MTTAEPLEGPATLSFQGSTIDLPVEHPTLGRTAVDISGLGPFGLAVFDPGYADTAAYHSAITFVDGELGRLYYRGYPVEQLATSRSYLEVAYLLIYGELPTAAAADEFIARVRDPKLVLHVGIERLFDSFPQSMHPMAMMAIATEAMTAYGGTGHSTDNRARAEEAGTRLLSAMPIFAGYALSVLRGLPRGKSNRSLDYTEDLLQLCFSIPGSDHMPDSAAVSALNTLLILHADHEFNCSTATLRMVASSGASFYAGASAAINALWGPLHGGANQQVMQMLQEIRDSGKPLSHFVDKAKDKSDDFRLMGFGHRVYKTTDARAKVIRQIALDLMEKRAADDPLLEIAMRLEEVALADDYFISRRLYPNVDFYSGIIYRAIGFPDEMMTPMFVVGRLAGWVAHWIELTTSQANKIGRPTQIYTGPAERAVPSRVP
ncbi:MAG TPA: citrate/2-methylcitrate synthase [Acidimicrobiales bacterium]|nr:citrate/2-methylcitrate synthase [Acidimicrobiales bacterium]